MVTADLQIPNQCSIGSGGNNTPIECDISSTSNALVLETILKVQP